MDSQLLYWLADLQHPLLNKVMIFITTLGNKGYIWFAIIALLFCIKSQRRFALFCLAALLFEYALNDLIIKSLVMRPRPFFTHDFTLLIHAPTSYSFPSGHSASSFTMAGMFLFNRCKVRYIILLLASLIAFSRLYLSVHYPSDVLVGALLGLIIAWLFSYKFKQMQENK